MRHYTWDVDEFYGTVQVTVEELPHNGVPVEELPHNGVPVEELPHTGVPVEELPHNGEPSWDCCVYYLPYLTN